MTEGRIDRFPFASKPARRVVVEPQIVGHLLVYGYADEVHGGNVAAGLADCRQVLRDWRDLGLKTGTARNGEPTYDPGEVINFMKWAAIHAGHPFWSRCVRSGRRRLRRLAQTRPATALFCWERRLVTTADLPAGRRRRFALPRPLADAWTSQVEVRNAQGSEPVEESRGCLEIGGGNGSAQPWISYEALLSLRSRAARETSIGQREREIYTRVADGPVRVTDNLRAIVAPLRHPFDERSSALALFDYFLDAFFVGVPDYTEVYRRGPIDVALETKLVDCFTAAVLLVAMCRACGLPARVVRGNFLYPTLPSAHWWAEVYTRDEGWWHLDTIAWDLSAGGRDEQYRQVLLGDLEPRVTLEVLPHSVAGLAAGRLPPTWYWLTAHEHSHLVTTYADYRTGSALFVDRVRVVPGAPSAG